MITILTKLKSYALLSLGGLSAALYFMFKWQSNKADKANERADDEHERADKYRDANIENQTAINKAKDGEANAKNIARMSSNDRRNRLRKYVRDNNKI